MTTGVLQRGDRVRWRPAPGAAWSSGVVDQLRLHRGGGQAVELARVDLGELAPQDLAHLVVTVKGRFGRRAVRAGGGSELVVEPE